MSVCWTSVCCRLRVLTAELLRQHTTQIFGCIDERGILLANQVFAHVTGVGWLEGRILVTRSPW